MSINYACVMVGYITDSKGEPILPEGMKALLKVRERGYPRIYATESLFCRRTSTRDSTSRLLVQ